MHDTREWQALSAHRAALDGVHLRDLFDGDPQRGERLCAETDGWLLDYSKNRLTDETVELLAALADRAGLRRHIEAMLDGEPVNTTEDRPAWHAALRQPDPPPEVRQELDHMAAFAAEARGGRWQAVVNIGIGGSDLGPAMATAALAAYANADLEVRFLSNVDGAHFREITRDLDPARTLFIVVSKTFTTAETLTNAITARAWVAEAVGPDKAGGHFAAVTASPEKAQDFGIDPGAVFAMWDWVGGRYSLASAVGLSLMAAVGPNAFVELLAGMHQIDQHYRTAPWTENLPALLGLIGIWNRNFWGWPTYAVLPYSQELALFPAYIQQLDMESSGKSVRADGSPAGTTTGPVVWGQPGTNGQHAFHQLLHQGTDIVPAEFIGFCRPNHGPHRAPRPAYGQLVRPGRGPGLRRTRPRRPPPELSRQPAQHRGPRRSAHPPLAGPTGGPLRAQSVYASHGVGHQPLRPVGSRARQDPGHRHHRPTHRRSHSQPLPRFLHPIPHQPLRRPPARCDKIRATTTRELEDRRAERVSAGTDR